MDFVLIGGVAATIHGSDQMTKDLDIVPERVPANYQRLAAALRALGARRVTYPEFPTEPAGSDFARSPVEHYVCPIGAIDVLLEPHGVGGFENLVGRSTPMPVGTVMIQVADLDALIQSKSGTGRPKDTVHVRSLERLRELLAEQRLRGTAESGE